MSITSPTQAAPDGRHNHRIRPLTSARRDETVQVVRIDAGRRLAQRLMELGLTPGVIVQVVHVNGGPMLIAVRGARLAIGRGMAEKIMVKTPEVEDV
jgi:Fe2+ transport system protein FeoA